MKNVSRLCLALALVGAANLLADEPASNKTTAPTAALKVPPGFTAAADTGAEPYSNTGWAQEIVHAASGIAFVFVPAGRFRMGTPPDEDERMDGEKPHQVTLTKAFYLGKFEVTQAQWLAAMGTNPSAFTAAGNDAPVEQVSWDDCQEFIAKLNAALLPPLGQPSVPSAQNPVPSTQVPSFRLPTEAEWEYACRAGTRGQFAGKLDDLGWFATNSDQTTHPVGLKQPNRWGLYDMHGNVWEWCADLVSDYPDDDVTDPAGPATGQFRLFRGGCWTNVARGCRAAGRLAVAPTLRSNYIGCRLALSLPAAP